MEIQSNGEEGSSIGFRGWSAHRRRLKPDDSFFAAGNIERELLAKQVNLSIFPRLHLYFYSVCRFHFVNLCKNFFKRGLLLGIKGISLIDWIWPKIYAGNSLEFEIPNPYDWSLDIVQIYVTSFSNISILPRVRLIHHAVLCIYLFPHRKRNSRNVDWYITVW